MLPPHTPKVASPTDNPGSSPPHRDLPPLTPVVQTTACRHQLNAAPLGGAAPPALQPAPLPASCPESSSTPCAGAGPHAAASIDATTKQARPALGPPAALPVAGPSRGGGRTRGVLTRKATATRGRRLQMFTNETGPACDGCAASRAAGHASGGVPAVALAVVPPVCRLPNSFKRALREFQRRSTTRRLAMRKRRRLAGVRHRQVRNAGSNPEESAYRPRQSTRERHRKRSERPFRAFRQDKTLQSQSACSHPPQSAKR